MTEEKRETLTTRLDFAEVIDERLKIALGTPLEETMERVTLSMVAEMAEHGKAVSMGYLLRQYGELYDKYKELKGRMDEGARRIGNLQAAVAEHDMKLEKRNDSDSTTSTRPDTVVPQ